MTADRKPKSPNENKTYKQLFRSNFWPQDSAFMLENNLPTVLLLHSTSTRTLQYFSNRVGVCSRPEMGFYARQMAIRLQHFPDQGSKRPARGPAEDTVRFRGIADQNLDLRRPV